MTIISSSLQTSGVEIQKARDFLSRANFALKVLKH